MHQHEHRDQRREIQGTTPPAVAPAHGASVLSTRRRRRSGCGAPLGAEHRAGAGDEGRRSGDVRHPPLRLREHGGERRGVEALRHAPVLGHVAERAGVGADDEHADAARHQHVPVRQVLAGRHPVDEEHVARRLARRDGRPLRLQLAHERRDPDPARHEQQGRGPILREGERADTVTARTGLPSGSTSSACLKPRHRLPGAHRDAQRGVAGRDTIVRARRMPRTVRAARGSCSARYWPARCRTGESGVTRNRSGCRQRAAPGEAQLRRDGTGEQHGEHVADQQRELGARAERGHPERQHVRYREQHGDQARHEHPLTGAGWQGDRLREHEAGEEDQRGARQRDGQRRQRLRALHDRGRRLEQRAAGHEHQSRQHGADAQGDDEPGDGHERQQHRVRDPPDPAGQPGEADHEGAGGGGVQHVPAADGHEVLRRGGDDRGGREEQQVHRLRRRVEQQEEDQPGDQGRRAVHRRPGDRAHQGGATRAATSATTRLVTSAAVG